MFAKHCVRMSLLLPGYERDGVILLVLGITPLLFVRSSPEGWETTVWDENGLTVLEVFGGMGEMTDEEDDEANENEEEVGGNAAAEDKEE